LAVASATPSPEQTPALAVHGGAGAWSPSDADPVEIRRALAESLRAGFEVLAGGGAALEAVERAVVVLEDHPLFTAGRGAALTATGEVELDAAIMDGRGRAAGAVACLRGFANPVRAARLVLERSPHVLLVGPGAEAFAAAHGLPHVDPAALVTAAAFADLERVRRAERRDGRGGTVGAVARDAAGHLAAATSTGGVTNQLPGRVGDSPLIGAGTFADDASCAVSATGAGEAFVRAAFAHEVDARMRLLGASLEAACRGALAGVAALGAQGGCAAVDRAGRVALPFTTSAMPRGWALADGEPRVAIGPGELESVR
jgi:isoaspartyl peptidase/L-asparaginase-like protein (Ntn-hydrolase superfamily)